MTGIHMMEITTMISTKARPTIRSSTSVACLRILVQMSMVKMVEEELKMEVREDIRAANITANINPDNPSDKFNTYMSSDVSLFDEQAAVKTVILIYD